MTKLRRHPLSAAFPAMAEAELSALVEDVRENGQGVPGVMFQGMILDGWHRYLACQEVGVAFRSVDFDEADPLSFVRSRNLHRRHLNASQRAAVEVDLSEWATGGRNRRSSAAAADVRTTAEMAHSAEVSPRTIEHAKAAHKAGLGDAVKDGIVTAERAAEVAKLPKKERAAALKEKPEPKPKVVIAERKFEKLYEEVKAELTDTKESLAEMTAIAESVKAFEGKQEFKEMQVLRAELASCKRRRDDLMRENTEQKKQIAYWNKKAEGGKK